MDSKKTKPLDRITFILRLSPIRLDEVDMQKMEWRGQLQDVRSGEVAPFQGLDALCELLQARLDGRPDLPQKAAGGRSGGLR